MTAITRRAAMASAGAAVAVAGVPGAVQSSAQDPVIALIDRAIALHAKANDIERQGDPMGGEQIDAEAGHIECEVFRTPATTFQGIVAKVRVAYRISVCENTSRAPLEDMTPPTDDDIGGLDRSQLLWSILRDLERLDVEARS